MRRRIFLLGLGMATVWSKIAAADRKPRLVGMMTAFSEADAKPLRTSLVTKLSTLGWDIGQNVELDVLAIGAGSSTIDEAAASMVNRQPDVIIAQGSPILTALRKQSVRTPIVFTLVSDPVGLGFVNSLSRPGGNITGFTNFEFSMGGKWVELLQQLGAGLSRILLVANPGNSASKPFAKEIEAAGAADQIEVRTVYVRDAKEIETAIRSNAGSGKTALITLPDFLPVNNRDLIVKITNELKVPNIHPFKTFPTHGGLMSYGIDFAEVYRQAAVYVDRILRGTQPADLPVQAPNKFELVINLRTAKSLGFELSPALLARADETIE
jgi:putative ABC transport system substrate-binding protein